MRAGNGRRTRWRGRWRFVQLVAVELILVHRLQRVLELQEQQLFQLKLFQVFIQLVVAVVVFQLVVEVVVLELGPFRCRRQALSPSGRNAPSERAVQILDGPYGSQTAAAPE